MANGQKYHCGASHWPRWTRRVLSFFFNASCKIHDLDYGPKTKFLQSEGDKRFRENMYKQSERYGVFKPLLRLKARIYHWAVTTQGENNYDGNEARILEQRKRTSNAA